jgi:hypothetical protein
MVLLIDGETYVVLNLSKDKAEHHTIVWWVNDEKNFKDFIKMILDNDGIEYKEQTIDDILKNYLQMYM